jgi:hypothetical protein
MKFDNRRNDDLNNNYNLSQDFPYNSNMNLNNMNNMNNFSQLPLGDLNNSNVNMLQLISSLTGNNSNLNSSSHLNDYGGIGDNSIINSLSSLSNNNKQGKEYNEFKDYDYKSSKIQQDNFKSPLNNINNLIPNYQNLPQDLVNIISSTSNLNNNSSNNNNLNVLANALISSISNPSQVNQPSSQSNYSRTNYPRSNTNESNSHSSDLKHSLYKIDDNLSHLFKNPRKNATNIVFIEGLPSDATEREVSHLLRPFPGFICCRIKEAKKEIGGKKNLISFCDFEEVYQATIVIHTLQGYRFDKNDLVGLHFGYGVNKHNQRARN